MLTWAGVGWAVANAHPALLEVADRTCPGNDDDGVAEVLEAVLDQRQ
ncbi:HAD family hydrolase [Terrabacter terrigena]|uniref:HAD family hydrolase n=1 Tax=Terrabacter terrigena TaxID=574718 RepID=A0ABW3MQX7_9MICO